MAHVRGGREAKRRRQEWALQQREQELEKPEVKANGAILNASQTASRVRRITQEISSLHGAGAGLRIDGDK